MADEQLLTPREVAAITRLALPTIYKLAQSRRLRSLRLGNRIRFWRGDVLTWLATTERRPSPPGSGPERQP